MERTEAGCRVEIRPNGLARLIAIMGLQMEKIIEFLPKLLESIAKTRIHYILLSFSFVLVALSISFNRYFFETFLTFIYAVVFAHIQLARKQEFVDGFEERRRLFYYNFLSILFIVATVFWVIEIYRLSSSF